MVVLYSSSMETTEKFKMKQHLMKEIKKGSKQKMEFNYKSFLIKNVYDKMKMI